MSHAKFYSYRNFYGRYLSHVETTARVGRNAEHKCFGFLRSSQHFKWG